MVSLLRLVQIILCSPGYYLFLIAQVMYHHIKKAHDLRLIIYQSKHNDTEGVLKLRVFIKLIQNDIRIGILSQLNDNSDSFTVGLIADIRDAINLL